MFCKKVSEKNRLQVLGGAAGSRCVVDAREVQNPPSSFLSYQNPAVRIRASDVTFDAGHLVVWIPPRRHARPNV